MIHKNKFCALTKSNLRHSICQMTRGMRHCR